MRVVVELLKSRWGNSYHVNVGVILRDLEDRPAGPVHKCHVYGRWSPAAVEAALDFDQSADDPDRRVAIASHVETWLLPILDQLASDDGIRDVAARNALGNVLAAPAARARLFVLPGEQ
jgi:hypothetical protein